MTAIPLTLVWPVCFLLIAWLLVRKFFEDIRPIVKVVVNGVAVNAGQHALGYALVCILSILSGLNALADVATEFHWPVVVAATKILAPMLSTVVAYVMKPPAFMQANPDPPKPTVTNP